jgi:calcineurin-like phosphoesterase family protein
VIGGINMIFYTDELHFGHKGILKHSYRPFETIEQHDDLIDNVLKYASIRGKWLTFSRE